MPQQQRYLWSTLSPLQLGRYAEYLTKMEFTLFGFEVYQSEVDDRGIDFVIRQHPDRYHDIQVKSIRGFGYVFFQKSKFEKRPNLLAALVMFEDLVPPRMFLIPATAWLNTNDLLKDKDYPGMKSKPEYGLNISQKNMPLLEPYRFDLVVETLLTRRTKGC